jgi:hypothetical protein
MQGLDIRQGLWYNAGAQIQVSVLPPTRGMSETASIMRYVPVPRTGRLFPRVLRAALWSDSAQMHSETENHLRVAYCWLDE